MSCQSTVFMRYILFMDHVQVFLQNKNYCLTMSLAERKGKGREGAFEGMEWGGEYWICVCEGRGEWEGRFNYS